MFPSRRVGVPGTSVLQAFSPRAQTWAPLARTWTRTGPNLPGDAARPPTAAARRRGRGGARGGRAGSAPPGGPPFSPSPPPLSPLPLPLLPVSLSLSSPFPPPGAGPLLPRAPAPPRPHKGPSPWQPRWPQRSADRGTGAIEPRRQTSRYGNGVRGPRGGRASGGLRRQRRSVLACGDRDAGTRATAARRRNTRAAAAVRASGRPGPGRSHLALFQVAGEARGAEGSGPGPAEGP